MRYDPFDIGVVYAYVQGHWIVCCSPYNCLLEGHTEKELQVATAEMRQHAKRDRTRADLSAARLAAFIAESHAHEELLQQWKKKRTGQQAPRRDQVGPQAPAEEKPGKCSF